MKADGVRKPEGSISLHVMASVEVTTGVRDQGMHSQGRRGNSGEDITVRKPLLTSRHISREDSPPPMRASCEGHKSRRVDKVPGADS